MAKLRLLLGDDHTLVRHGLRKILEERTDWEVVAEVGDGREAVRRVLALKPDVAILDIGMPQLNGIDATQQIVRRAPETCPRRRRVMRAMMPPSPSLSARITSST